MKRNGHPDSAMLALHAGGDLGWFTAWKTAHHVAGCADCRDEIEAFRGMRALLPELHAMPELPWNRIAGEMRANIRLGLSAGECVRDTAPPEREAPLFGGFRAAIAMALSNSWSLPAFRTMISCPTFRAAAGTSLK